MSGRQGGESSRLEPPSKSELKRRVRARHRLVEDLVELSEGLLRKIDLTAATLADLAQIRQMKPSHARNRAIKHLASKLLDSEREAADAFVHDRKALQAEQTRRFHRLERWRDRLLEEGDAALGELCAAHPQLDRQHLRTLIRAAQKEREGGKPSGAARKLFHQIGELLD